MTREEGLIEEYGYDRMATLELGKQDKKNRHTDLKSSDIQLHERLKPCTGYKMWMFSLLMGSCLIATSGFSLYLGNVFPSEMDYLRCAAGSCLPSAVVHFAVLKNKVNVMYHYQILFVSTFSITTTCLIWFGCKLAINPTAININFNLILLILMEILMATTVIISARSNVDCCKVQRIVEVIVGVCAVFGGVIALNFDALLHSLYLYVSIFWVLAACFPNAVVSHIAAEYPTKCLVEGLIVTSSITSPLLFATSAFLSFSIIRTIDIFRIYPAIVTHFHDIVLFLLMLILLVQALLTNITIIQCVHYKTLMRIDDLSWNMSQVDKMDYRNNDVSNNTLREFDKDKAWKAVVVQMTQ
ncbi:hypothetical protein XENTR_v10008712 [Xenopus tropicalis]|uniref:Megalencephalic leukoencephalopathy with subcortical cysts 1 n=1 Tax=Xenopus tropicalis TaxID=8364 RepID=A0A803J6F2_XENTR|nr:membrane protein MLC1 isoform X2 [Xenopus tropicalis]KAE8616085.1 hypothetical protein XENTR_v10008712 [Xenopus tropicalis]|eukprot:XP_012814778.1 PREDICTED: membrane protein MLC1 isoform X2 [Xenopus tropicalis]